MLHGHLAPAPLPLPALTAAGLSAGLPTICQGWQKLAKKFKSYREETGESTFGQAAFPCKVRQKGTWQHLFDAEEAPHHHPPCGKQSISRRGVFYVLALERQNLTPKANVRSGMWCGFCAKCFPMLRGRAAAPVREQQGGARRVLQETAVAVSPCKLTTCTELARIKRNQPRRQGDSDTSVKVLSSQCRVGHLGFGSASRCGGTTRRG